MTWWLVLDADGVAVSEGTVLADPLPDGLTAVEVDGPSDGRPWDPDTKAWGQRPEPPAQPPPASGVDLAKLTEARELLRGATTLAGIRTVVETLIDGVAGPAQVIAPSGGIVTDEGAEPTELSGGQPVA